MNSFFTSLRDCLGGDRTQNPGSEKIPILLSDLSCASFKNLEIPFGLQGKVLSKKKNPKKTLRILV
ncbi:hypothetical protein CH375_13405 [Leptospira ellisii]|uniref:Uncharacterized protein n=1 Tax=Leptospira ellisii TaxID=2023197 RepID=A0A2N0B827_9LEPT|nr:hypothetical protein CH379_11725 [Leptospira ellisii]PKA04031.1 hypothetical protein CH375_13405 [Leptospira ellisii]